MSSACDRLGLLGLRINAQSLASLVGMGFEEKESRRALRATRGNLDAALGHIEEARARAAMAQAREDIRAR